MQKGLKKGIYLGSCLAFHSNYNLDYNDIKPYEHVNVLGKMEEIDLTNYDYFVCTPPCNFYSRARGNKISAYALETKHLLPDMIIKLSKTGKPFLIENVINRKRFEEEGIYSICEKLGVKIIEYSRHTYFTNFSITTEDIPSRQDFTYGGHRIDYGDWFSKYNQGGYNVYHFVEKWLRLVNEFIGKGVIGGA